MIKKQRFDLIEKKEVTHLPQPKTSRPGFSISKNKKEA